MSKIPPPLPWYPHDLIRSGILFQCAITTTITAQCFTLTKINKDFEVSKVMYLGMIICATVITCGTDNYWSYEEKNTKFGTEIVVHLLFDWDLQTLSFPPPFHVLPLLLVISHDKGGRGGGNI